MKGLRDLCLLRTENSLNLSCIDGRTVDADDDDHATYLFTEFVENSKVHVLAAFSDGTLWVLGQTSPNLYSFMCALTPYETHFGQPTTIAGAIARAVRCNAFVAMRAYSCNALISQTVRTARKYHELRTNGGGSKGATIELAP